MRGKTEAMFILASLSLGTAGCAWDSEARYVYQDGQYGVVGIPSNTDHWPTRYRKQAEKLMGEHFPRGYEVIRAEEVVEGSRTLTIGGTRSAEVSPQLPTELLKVGKLGRTATRNQSDTLKIKECRIIYRKADDGALRGDFAAQASLTPTTYIDPNAKERGQAVDRGDGPPPADDAVKAASRTAKASTPADGPAESTD